MNLPNKLTMLRVLLIPVFMVCAANRWMLAAGIIFAVAAGAPGGKVIAANMWGKVKTALQMLTICFYYFGYAAEAAFSAHPERSVFATQVISYVLCWVVAAVTLISGVKYLWDNRHFINTAK